jgi:choice-of-anchor B domain-containing protein
MQPKNPVCLAAALLGAAALAPCQSSLNINLITHIPGVACATGGIWAIGQTHVLVGRRSRGWSIVDVRDPQNPIVQDVFPPSYPRSDIRSYGCGEVKYDGRYIYVTNEDFYQGNQGGVFIYDAQPNPMAPVLVNNYQPFELNGGVHNIWVSGNYMYCVSDRTSLIEVYDVTNKTAPVRVSSLGNGIANVWAHDVIVLDNRAYCSLLTGGFAIYDVANPAAPVLLANVTYSNPFTHNCWPTPDRRFLYTTDENIVGGQGGGVRIWDIQNLSNVTQVGSYHTGATSSIVHNVHVVDDLLYVAFYKEGVRVLSLQPNPAAPVEVAHYDTFPAGVTPCFSSPNYAGNWGVYPLNPNTLIASDLDRGLFLLNLRPITNTFTATPNPVSGGQVLNLSLNYTNASPGVLDGFGAIVATRIATIPLFEVLALDGATLNPSQTRNLPLALPVPPGLPPGLVVEFTGISGLFGTEHFVFCQRSPVPVTVQ